MLLRLKVRETTVSSVLHIIVTKLNSSFLLLWNSVASDFV